MQQKYLHLLSYNLNLWLSFSSSPHVRGRCRFDFCEIMETVAPPYVEAVAY
ncbi:Uncharacterized protein dnl_56290 [Desulfonema limicola]|uniref:Uncharacterized protein n=1 Tax=Desulfonema limicola TaxID=45656 RepID=A0A975GJ76_9BACT|nr:Uncharacterized protein dnl_56290 [Desulfonema limicola]